MAESPQALCGPLHPGLRHACWSHSGEGQMCLSWEVAYCITMYMEMFFVCI